MISLKLLAHQLLLGCPSDGNASFKHLGTKTDTKQIFLPGELSRIKLAFPAPVVLFVSSNNPGASQTAGRLQKGMVGLSVTSETPTLFGSGKRLRQKAAAGGVGHLVGSGRNLLSGLVASVGGTAGTAGAPAAGPANGAAGHATHMLLYLNEATFVGPEGALLADEVRTAQHRPWPEPLIFAQCPSPSPGPEPDADVHLPSHLLCRCGLRGPPRSLCCCCTRTTRPAAAAYSRNSSRRPRRHAVRIGAILTVVVILTYSARPPYLGSDQPPRERGSPEGEGALLTARARALLWPLLDGLRRARGQVSRRAQRRRAALPQDAGRPTRDTMAIPSLCTATKHGYCHEPALTIPGVRVAPLPSIYPR